MPMGIRVASRSAVKPDYQRPEVMECKSPNNPALGFIKVVLPRPNSTADRQTDKLRDFMT